MNKAKDLPGNKTWCRLVVEYLTHVGPSSVSNLSPTIKHAMRSISSSRILVEHLIGSGVGRLLGKDRHLGLSARQPGEGTTDFMPVAKETWKPLCVLFEGLQQD